MVSSNCHTPVLSAELRSMIMERNMLTTRTRFKVLSALDNMTKTAIEEKQQRLRSKAIDEILSSEMAYLKQLEIIMTFFMEPLKSKPFISHGTYTTLFGHIETLYKVNGELLNELKNNPSNIAAAFLKMAPFFKLYSVYAYDYRQAITTLQELQVVNSELNSFIAQQETRPEVSTKLTSLLITPIQRVPRYCLLLREVLNYTSPSSSEFRVLSDSLREVERSAAHINNLVQDYENMQKMVEIQRNLSRGVPRIITPGRKFIKEGMLMKVSPSGKRAHQRYFVLFNDLLIYCKLLRPNYWEPNSLLCSCVLPLKKCRVEEILSSGMFKITCQHEILILYCDSAREGAEWISALRQAVKQYHECRQTLRRDSSSKKPVRRAALSELNQDFPTPAKKRRTEGVAPVQSHRRNRSSWGMKRLNCIQLNRSCPATVNKKEELSPYGFKDSLYPLRKSQRSRQHSVPKITSETPKPNTKENAMSTTMNISSASTIDNISADISLGGTWHVRGYQLIQYFFTSIARSIRKHIFQHAPTAPPFEYK